MPAISSAMQQVVPPPALPASVPKANQLRCRTFRDTDWLGVPGLAYGTDCCSTIPGGRKCAGNFLLKFAGVGQWDSWWWLPSHPPCPFSHVFCLVASLSMLFSISPFFPPFLSFPFRNHFRSLLRTHTLLLHLLLTVFSLSFRFAFCPSIFHCFFFPSFLFFTSPARTLPFLSLPVPNLHFRFYALFIFHLLRMVNHDNPKYPIGRSGTFWSLLVFGELSQLAPVADRGSGYH